MLKLQNEIRNIFDCNNGLVRRPEYSYSEELLALESHDKKMSLCCGPSTGVRSETRIDGDNPFQRLVQVTQNDRRWESIVMSRVLDVATPQKHQL